MTCDICLPKPPNFYKLGHLCKNGNCGLLCLHVESRDDSNDVPQRLHNAFNFGGFVRGGNLSANSLVNRLKEMLNNYNDIKKVELLRLAVLDQLFISEIRIWLEFAFQSAHSHGAKTICQQNGMNPRPKHIGFFKSPDGAINTPQALAELYSPYALEAKQVTEEQLAQLFLIQGVPTGNRNPLKKLGFSVPQLTNPKESWNNICDYLEEARYDASIQLAWESELYVRYELSWRILGGGPEGYVLAAHFHCYPENNNPNNLIG